MTDRCECSRLINVIDYVQIAYWIIQKWAFVDNEMTVKFLCIVSQAV